MVFDANDSRASDSEFAPAISVVVAYEDLEAGKYARGVCASLERNLGEKNCFLSELWKFDLLAVPGFREIAAHDAALADIIFISCHGSADMPAEVKAWVELWLGRQAAACALVALFDRSAESARRLGAIQDYLATVAKRGGMEFFAQPDVWPDNPAARARSARGPSVRLESEVAFLVAAVAARHEFVDHWGLNE